MISKKDAQYRVAGIAGKQCADCEEFVPPMECETVAGQIGAKGTCKFWHPPERGGEEMERMENELFVGKGEMNGES